MTDYLTCWIITLLSDSFHRSFIILWHLTAPTFHHFVLLPVKMCRTQFFHNSPRAELYGWDDICFLRLRYRWVQNFEGKMWKSLSKYSWFILLRQVSSRIHWGTGRSVYRSVAALWAPWISFHNIEKNSHDFLRPPASSLHPRWIEEERHWGWKRKVMRTF